MRASDLLAEAPRHARPECDYAVFALHYVQMEEMQRGALLSN
jgi:hypothetical protein